ncbi:hypothetical protein [Prevotella sp. E2-28]|uniref:hypothetical protein n=1 Tax=Prevotella sp. E2-28 TaxID=2913620 RepID=UPI001EDBA832|nr:hypothetical protein [Prevotella sp. E2-28]UKK52980.1 hypothetical protein L6465_10340 [Prevotella sp. E2-28]
MKRLLLSLMMFACFQISFNTSFARASVSSTLELPDDCILLEEFYVKNVCWCGTKLDNVHYIITSDELPLKVCTYLEGRKINLILINENNKSVRFNLICNGFVHPYEDPVGKEKVDSDYTYTKTLAQGESEKYTIGHRSMIPIIGHGGVPEETKDLGKAYLDMLYSGFDVSTCHSCHTDSINKMLCAAKDKGLKLIIGHGYQNPSWYSDLVNNTQNNKNSIYGYYIGDEPFLEKDNNHPNHATIENLVPKANEIRCADSNANIHICLNPIYWSVMKVYDNNKNHIGYNNQLYSDYIDSCIKRLELSNIAFDNYSISTNSNGKRVIKCQWFDNLEIIRSQSLKHNIPFRGYILSSQHLYYLMPTLGTMRLQMYANLAYGAKSIAYYTYWHRWLPGEGSYVAPIDSFGQRRAELYNVVNRVNEEMARISPLFAEGTVKRVFHINGASSNKLVRNLTQDHLPDNIESLSIERDASVDSASAIASIITKGDSSFLAIVNKDFDNPIKLHIKGNKYLYHVSKLDLKNEAITTGDYTIDAGDIIIFNLTQRRSKVPIVAYWGVPEDKASVEAYDELYNAGFDISLRPINNENKAIKSLQYADTANIKLILGNASYEFNDASLVPKTKDYESLYGYFVRDEPNSADLPNVKKRIDNIHKYASNRFCYVKMKPAYYTNFYNDIDFTNYLNSISQLDIKVLTYRYTPFFTTAEKEDDNWYRYLEKIRKANKDFWGCIQCTKQQWVVQPTLGKLRLQTSVNLAYGAKALEYLYYWNPKKDSESAEGCSYSPIKYDGNRNTEVYSWVNMLNEEIAEVSSKFANGIIEEVYHINSIPTGTSDFKDFINTDKLNITISGNQGGIVSFLKNNGKTYMVIVNKDFNNQRLFSISPKNIVITDSDIDSLDNTPQLPKSRENATELRIINKLIVQIPAGGIKVYKLNTDLCFLKKENKPKTMAEPQSSQKISVNNIPDTHTPVSVQIYTTSGVNVYSGPISGGFIDNNIFDIELPNSLRRGKCYIIKVNCANNSYVKKIAL